MKTVGIQVVCATIAFAVCGIGSVHTEKLVRAGMSSEIS